jgi:hypothetical protein
MTGKPGLRLPTLTPAVAAVTGAVIVTLTGRAAAPTAIAGHVYEIVHVYRAEVSTAGATTESQFCGVFPSEARKMLLLPLPVIVTPAFGQVVLTLARVPETAATFTPLVLTSSKNVTVIWHVAPAESVLHPTPDIPVTFAALVVSVC